MKIHEAINLKYYIVSAPNEKEFKKNKFKVLRISKNRYLYFLTLIGFDVAVLKDKVRKMEQLLKMTTYKSGMHKEFLAEITKGKPDEYFIYKKRKNENVKEKK